MSKRRTVFVVLIGGTCVVLIAGFAAIRWAVRVYDELLPSLRFAAEMASESSEPPEPRPMFHEWGATDHGYQWNLVPFYQDSAGVWMQMDARLNIIVVFATGHRVSEWGPTRADHECAVFRRGTPYEVTVRNTANTLVWVGTADQARLATELGVAARVEETVRNDPEAHANLLRTLVRCYEGVDRSKLEALVEGYENAATSRPDGESPGLPGDGSSDP